MPPPPPPHLPPHSLLHSPSYPSVSRRGAASWSLHLLEHFTRQWAAAHNGLVTTRDTFDIPHLDYDSLEAGRTPVELQSHEQRQSFDLSK